MAASAERTKIEILGGILPIFTLESEVFQPSAQVFEPNAQVFLERGGETQQKLWEIDEK